MDWKSRIDASLPYWQDYLPLLDRLDGVRFPACADLNSLLPPGLATASERPVRFRPDRELPDTPYEQHIDASGEVSTRADNWHDLFNALVWARMPGIKVAMNARHCSGKQVQPTGARGPLRDALTLFDECGVIIAGGNGEFLTALAQKDWPAVFGTWRAFWRTGATVVITGHAMLEKFLEPYKSMTANALLIQTGEGFRSLAREERLAFLDATIADLILAGEMLARPGSLSPLPLTGIPGWWAGGRQDGDFYADERVFRPVRKGFTPAPIYRID